MRDSQIKERFRELVNAKGINHALENVCSKFLRRSLICEHKKRGLSLGSIAIKFNISKEAVSQCKCKKATHRD